MIQIANLPTGQRYSAVQAEVDRRFPAGRFVAVQEQRVVADAPSHRLLVEQLQSQGLGPKDLLILQAGVEFPDSAVIF